LVAPGRPGRAGQQRNRLAVMFNVSCSNVGPEAG
jgi:hypothetical protein